MITRDLSNQVLQALREFPAVVLLGPRQVGKTTMAKSLASGIGSSQGTRPNYLDLELPEDLAKLADPQHYLEHFTDRLIIIDEVQRRPELFPILRALIDRARHPGRFLLLGSASPSLLEKSSDSLAGRVCYLELGPFSRLELEGIPQEKEHWWRGGYPNALLGKNLSQIRRWHEALIRTYVERDLPQLGYRVPGTELRRFWTMLAHNHGQLWNASQLASGFGVTSPTMRRYLSAFEETYLVRLLRPWHVNTKKRLVKSPKIYIRDSGILHTLLGIRNFEGLLSHPNLGASWEGYVIEQISNQLANQADIYFYRTQVGAEIDLLIVRGVEVLAAVEIKHTLSPKVSRGVYEVRQDLGTPPTWLIYAGNETFPLTNQITATSMLSFLRDVLPTFF